MFDKWLQARNSTETDPTSVRKVALQWVLYEGGLHHVSEFANLAPEKRPDVTCPVCQRPVTMKLGNIREHHVAHQPEAICAATQPETALHLNVKYHLFRQLQTAKQLLITQQCRGSMPHGFQMPCDNTRIIPYYHDWDSVEVEQRFGSYILDIGIIKNGQTIGGLEVRVTHSVEDEKASFLSQSGVAWVEFLGTVDFYSPPTAWTPSQPIQPIRFNDAADIVAPWQCDECRQNEEETRKRLEQQARKDEYKKQLHTLVMRVTDFYWRSGKKYRELFQITQRVIDGKVVEAWLADDKFKKIQVVTGAAAQNCTPLLEQAYTKHIASIRNAIIDSPMVWQSWPERFHPKMVWDEGLFPYRYTWVNNQWKLLAKYKDTRWDKDWNNLLSHRKAYYRY